jgi:CHASE2 domain-containing sensor protein
VVERVSEEEMDFNEWLRLRWRCDPNFKWMLFCMVCLEVAVLWLSMSTMLFRIAWVAWAPFGLALVFVATLVWAWQKDKKDTEVAMCKK